MKFYYKPFERKKYWSNRSHKYYTSKSISDMLDKAKEDAEKNGKNDRSYAKSVKIEWEE